MMFGGLSESRIGSVVTAVPVEPVELVEGVMVAPKSGLGSRLLPVRGKCEMP